jgi:hypothetical protein
MGDKESKVQQVTEMYLPCVCSCHIQDLVTKFRSHG